MPGMSISRSCKIQPRGRSDAWELIKGSFAHQSIGSANIISRFPSSSSVSNPPQTCTPNKTSPWSSPHCSHSLPLLLLHVRPRRAVPLRDAKLIRFALGDVTAINGVKAPTLKANHEGGFSAEDYKSGAMAREYTFDFGRTFETRPWAANNVIARRCYGHQRCQGPDPQGQPRGWLFHRGLQVGRCSS